MGFDTVSIAHMQLSHWPGIKKLLEDNGCEVVIIAVPATSSPIDRAKILEKMISGAYPGRAVHLIGHSMGGVDCRYLITHLTQRSFSVLSLTTISAPHHGAAFADHILSHAAGSILPSILPSSTSFRMEAMARDLILRHGKLWQSSTEICLTLKACAISVGVQDTSQCCLIRGTHWGTYLGTLKDVSHVGVLG
ncbi:hypothetical protein EDC04DRAFT_1014637 [Pisolithus marmoratus]|nr:hypothetical protein EDC04DRAFT_1014637 [Pisolithus marmoratus]